MPPTIGGITIDPQGQTLTVSVTPAAKVYTDAAGTTLASFPATVSTRTSYWMTAAQQYTVSVKTPAGNEIADATGHALVVDVQQGVMEGISPVIDRPGPEDTAAVGGPPTGAAGGDLTGTYPNPMIGALRTTITGAEQAANKGVANGYAGLGAGGLVPVAQLGTGTPTGSKFLRDDNTFAVPAGGGSSAGTMNGILNGVTDYSMVADCQTASDGAVAAGVLGTATFTGVVAGDVGKVIELYQTVTIPDAVISSGTAVLTSASNAVPAWVKAGMTINVGGAGAAGVSLVTTILSNDGVGQVTLNANASTTVSGAGKRAGIYAFHQTTIATAGTGTCTLTADAPYAFSGASVAWGTDNRAVFRTACIAAVTQRKTLYVPPGYYLFLGAAGNPYASSLLTAGYFRFRGERRETRFLQVLGSVPTTSYGFIQLGSNIDADIAGFEGGYLGPPCTANQSGFGTPVTMTRSGTATINVKLNGIDTDATFQPCYGLNWQTGTGTPPTYVFAENCEWVAQIHGATAFVNIGTTLHWFKGRNIRFESTFDVPTMSNDSLFNPHAFYFHPSMGFDLDRCTTKVRNNTTSGGAYHLHNNGSPTDIPQFWRVSNHVAEASDLGSGSIFNLSNTVCKKQTFERCVIRNIGPGIQCGSDATVADCEFYNNGFIGVTVTGTSKTINIARPGIYHSGSGSKLYSMAGATTSTIVVRDLNVTMPANWDVLGDSSTGNTTVVDGGAVTGNGVSGGSLQRIATGINFYLRNVRFAGSWNYAPLYTDAGAGSLTGYVEVGGCDFSGITGVALKDFTATGTDGNFTILPTNKFGAIGVTTAGRTGHRGMARPMLATATISAAANSIVTWDAQRFVFTTGGSPVSVNNVWRTDLAGTKMSGDIITLRNSGADTVTLKHGTGNMTCPAATDITLATNEIAELFSDGLGAWFVRKLA